MKGFPESDTDPIDSSSRKSLGCCNSPRKSPGSVSSEAEPGIGCSKHQKSAPLWSGIWPPAVSIFGHSSGSPKKSDCSSVIRKKSASGKNYYEAWRAAVRRVMMNGGSMRRYLGFNRTNVSNSNSDIWLLGVCYHVAQEGEECSNPTQSEGFAAFVEDFSSRILITYRKGFSPIGDSKYSSDVNWGCMLRSSQMLVAQAFLVHKLGRSCRKSSNKPLVESYMEILHLFGDAEDSPFSIHNLLEAGSAYGLAAGSWVGPYAMCRTWESLVRGKREESDGGVLSSMMGLYVVSGDEDGERGGAPVLCIEDISRYCSEFSRGQADWVPILLMVPLVLGLEKVNPRYLPLLCATFKFPQSLGILGGRPGASTYIVGVQDEKAFYLDPHEVQQVGLYLDPVVKASLINTYSKIGAMNLSEEVFVDTGNLKQVGVWANMISACVQSGIYEKAIILFQEMLEKGITPDMYIISSILSMIDKLTLGRQVHSYTIKLGMVSEVSVGSSILTMYSKWGKLEDSLKAFEQLERKDNISWTSMIVGLSEHGRADKAVQLFQEMGFKESTPDEKILAAVLYSCSALCSLKLGREIHGFALCCGFSDQPVINSALVNMYSKCGDLNSARIVFQRMPIKDQVSWSSLISGFSRGGHVEEALQLFHDLLLSDVSVDAFTISSIFGAALQISSKLDIGAQLHAYTIKMGFESEASVGSSLIMMYSKCGSIGECDKVFQQIIDPDLVCWTTMIASYANNGKGLEALQLFDQLKISGIEPDAVTFVGVLSACSHAGLVDEGYIHLHSMIKDYGIEPGQKHYACMVNILGRAGRLEEAKTFILSMPVKPTILVWETLLAACKVHGNHELGKLAAEKIMELQPCDVGAYISVSNIYAEAGEWDHVLKIREAMEETGVRRKEAGWSYV